MADNYDCWTLLSMEPKEPQGILNDKIIMRFDRKLRWDLLSKHYQFDEHMLRIYQHRVVWEDILQKQKLSETLLREFSPNFSSKCWEILSEKQRLSESFIRDFADRVDWYNIALYQNVSGKFLSDHKNHFSSHNNKDSVIISVDETD